MFMIAGMLTTVSGMKRSTEAYAATVTLDFSVNRSYTKAFRLLKLVNQQRRKAGLSTLTMDQSLLDAAMVRAQELVVSQSSTRPNGSYCLTAESAMAYGENYAYGYAKAATVLSSWLNSSSHKANLLRSNFKSAGVGVVKYQGQYFWVMEFGISVSLAAKAAGYSDGTVQAKVKVNTEADAYQPDINISAATMKTGDTAQLELAWGSGFFSFPVSNLKITNLTPKIISVSGSTVHAVEAGTGKLKIYLKGNRAGAVTLSIKVKKTKNSIAIKLVTNGGQLTGKRRSVIIGEAYGTLPVPERSGYTFLGWYTKRSGGVLITEASIVTKTKAHNLYAHWEKTKTT